jgi:2'-5' RNA ligase
VFVGLEPDAPARQQLTDVLRHLQARLGPLSAALRWNPAENVHLTLHFLGEVDAGRLSSLRTALGDPIPIAPFDLETGGLGTFPASGFPRVLWMAIAQGGDPAIRLHAELGTRLSQSGFAVETRPFSPHITLARVRERSQREAKGLAGALREVRIDPVRWRVDRATLFRSHLSSSAPKYEPLQHLRLTDYN